MKASGIFFPVRYFDRRGIRRRTELPEHKRDFVALDQLAGVLDSLRRAVGIVIGDEIYLAAVDAAAVVDLIDISDQPLAGVAERRGRSAEREGGPDLDLGGRDARSVRQRRQPWSA